MKKRATIIAVILVICCAATAGQYFSCSDSYALTGTARSDEDQEIEDMIDDMTLDEKIGQMFMGCFYNGTPKAETVSKNHLGAVLLFAPSFSGSSEKSVKKRIDDIKKGSDIIPFIAVDEEGGTVTRVSASSAFRDAPFRAPGDIYASGGMKAIVSDAHEKDQLLSDLGITLNLAPVCDISTNKNDFMYSRSLRQNAEVTSRYAEEVVKAAEEDNIGCCLKHFPGYGNASDTHNGISRDKRPLDQFEENDLLPFEAGIEAGAPAVLVSHNTVAAFDDDLPASLSPAVHKLLRYDLEFDGVIITDDMSMGAVSNVVDGMDDAVAAVLAGNDMICTGTYKKQENAVKEAVNDGIISEERIDSSVRRILSWKRSLSLL